MPSSAVLYSASCILICCFLLVSTILLVYFNSLILIGHIVVSHILVWIYCLMAFLDAVFGHILPDLLVAEFGGHSTVVFFNLPGNIVSSRIFLVPW